jgi:hypothetical protein
LRSIVQAMKSYWYDAPAIKKQLSDCQIPLEKENLQEIIKWLVSVL